MTRLIDADELRNDWLQNGQNEYVYDTNAFLESIGNAPTVEAVRHGEWVGYHGEQFCKDGKYRHYHFYVCSNCGRRTAVKTNFCPDCGCRMDGD